jgi:NADPH:quinone reductase-like Zn-dependent oxidoreductase
MRLDEIPRPVPGAGEVLVAVKAAGGGPWDRLVREGQSGLGQVLPLTLGSDISGTVAAVGVGVDGFALGEAAYGATNDQFIGGYAEWCAARRAASARARHRWRRKPAPTSMEPHAPGTSNAYGRWVPSPSGKVAALAHNCPPVLSMWSSTP